ncbi:hypothetical protein BH09SUM1_BH09SUM1_16370 [soil metagenome]
MGQLMPDSDFPIEKTQYRRPGRLGRFLRYHGAPMEGWWTPREAFAMASGAGPSPLGVLIFVMLVALYLAQASVYWPGVIDDSFITFRFVDMFANGHGWRFNPDAAPVEGFTNFLWALLLVVPAKLQWDLLFSAKVMGLASGVGAMLASVLLTRAVRNRSDLFNFIPAALLAGNAGFANWSLMGLETQLQTALIAAAFWRFEVERRDTRAWLLSPIAVMLAVMTRLDSLLYLCPLGVYGLWLVLLRRLPLKRFLLWLVLTGIPFAVYTVWRVTYFGDILPNTYYAKDRMIAFDGHGRGLEQLFHFYFHQSNVSRESWPWMNLWLLGFVLSALAACTGWLIPRGFLPRGFLWREAFGAKVVCLVLLPWAASVIYIARVNGDWMPGYRFFQVGLLFTGVAAAVGFGWLAQLPTVLRPASQWPASFRAMIGLAAFALLFGAIWEQMKINTVYIFGRNSFTYMERDPGWYRWQAIRANYRAGFMPTLPAVSDYLLVNTQENASIFMSDVGQPMWFATHLNLYDVDGLTNPRLAHAPSTRAASQPSIATLRKQITEEHGLTNPTRAQQRDIEMEAAQRDFDAQARRNADWIMNEVKPDYLLLFMNHDGDSSSSLYVYPKIADLVYRHAGMSNYEETWSAQKISTVKNHLFTRRDVARGVPSDVRLARLWRAIARNPRMPSLGILLYTEARAMTNLAQPERERVNRYMDHFMERWDEDPVIYDLADVARASGDLATAFAAAQTIERANSHDFTTLRGVASLHEQTGNIAAAERTLRRALAFPAAKDDDILLPQLMKYNEQLNKPLEVYHLGRMWVDRTPNDSAVWYDFATTLSRMALTGTLKDSEKRLFILEAKAAYQHSAEITGERSPDADATIEKLNAMLATLAPAP